MKVAFWSSPKLLLDCCCCYGVGIFRKQFPWIIKFFNYVLSQQFKRRMTRRFFIFEGAFLDQKLSARTNYTTVALVIYFARSALLKHIFLLSLYRPQNVINCPLAILNREGILIKNLQYKVPLLRCCIFDNFLACRIEWN